MWGQTLIGKRISSERLTAKEGNIKFTWAMWCPECKEQWLVGKGDPITLDDLPTKWRYCPVCGTEIVDMGEEFKKVKEMLG